MAVRVLGALLVVGAVCGNVVPHYDTIVVGLGSSGVTAATTLARAGKRVLGLEAQAYIGGRVRTVEFGDGIVELGAEWIHGTKRNRVYDLAMKHNISLVNQDMESRVYQSDRSPVNEALVNELLNFSLEAIVEYLPNKPKPFGQLITSSVTEYLRENKPDVLNDKGFLDKFFELVNLLVSTEAAANDWNDLSAWTRYEVLGGNQQASWHQYGYKTFFEILLNKYNNGPGLSSLETKLNTEVTQITWPQDPNESVKVTTKDGTVYDAKNVIVTVSLGVLKETHTTLFSSPLPPKKIKAIEQISMGVIGKVIFAFPHQWWPSIDTTYDFMWTAEDKKEVDAEDHWTLKLAGPSTPMANNYSLTLWTNGDTTKYIETLPEDVVRSKCMAVLRRFMGGNTTIPEPTHMLRSTWYTNPFTRGTYTYDNMQVAEHPDARVDLGSPLKDTAGKPRVLFAGEATNELHFATVHGASETGYREAMRLLHSADDHQREATVVRRRTVTRRGHGRNI